MEKRARGTASWFVCEHTEAPNAHRLQSSRGHFKTGLCIPVSELQGWIEDYVRAVRKIRVTVYASLLVCIIGVVKLFVIMTIDIY